VITPYSEEWWEARRGKITASRMMRALYGGPAGKNGLLDDLELELSPSYKRPKESDAPPLVWGRKQEPKCRALIELLYDVECYEPGLLFHPEVPIIGATPDYAVATNPEIVGEIKCPWKLKNHFKLMAGLYTNEDYVVQVQTQLLVMGLPVAWFTSYHPDAPEGQKLYRELVGPDLETHDKILTSCSELQRMLTSGSRYGKGVTKNAAGIPQLF
jgi:putative phage-type endonuclease